MAYEISVFVENKPGRIQKVTSLLDEGNIRIKAFRVSSLGEFGVIKLITSDPDKSFDLLRAAHLTVQKKQVMALACKQDCGLAPLAASVGEHGVNVDEALGISLNKDDESLMIFEVPPGVEVSSIGLPEGVRMLSDEELYSL
jgi:hypothetical protein